jgi:hypothetical protein
MNERRVAIVSHDAGGAEVLSSYVRRMGPGAASEFTFVLDGPARKIFEAKLGGLPRVPLETAIFRASSVLCGSGWQSDLELRAIALARHEHKKTAVFLDHWVNYRARFVRVAGQPPEFPDEVWVGDPHALERARAELPELPVVLVENPYLLDVRDAFAGRPPPPADNGLSVLFVCEPIREHALRQHGNERHWGYTEEEALRFFLDHVQALGQPIQNIVIRPHPAEPEGKYAAFLDGGGPPRRLSSAAQLVDDIAASHWVVGCHSMAMVVGLVAARQVLCCIPPGGPPCVLPFAEIRHLRSLVERRA